LKELSGFEVDSSETQKLSDQLFAAGTGVSDDEVKEILNAKPSKANKWELKKQLEGANSTVRVLKSTLNELMKCKNKFVLSSIETEKVTKKHWGRAVYLAKELDTERQQVKAGMKQMEVDLATIQEEKKDQAREFSSSQERVVSLEADLNSLKEKLDKSMRNHTEASIALELEKARSAEAEKRLKDFVRNYQK